MTVIVVFPIDNLLRPGENTRDQVTKLSEIAPKIGYFWGYKFFDEYLSSSEDALVSLRHSVSCEILAGFSVSVPEILATIIHREWVRSSEQDYGPIFHRLWTKVQIRPQCERDMSVCIPICDILLHFEIEDKKQKHVRRLNLTFFGSKILGGKYSQR